MLCCSTSKGSCDVHNELFDHSHDRVENDLLILHSLSYRDVDDDERRHGECKKSDGGLDSCSSSNDGDQQGGLSSMRPQRQMDGLAGLDMFSRIPVASEMLSSTPESSFSKGLSRFPASQNPSRESYIFRESTELSIDRPGEKDPLIATPRTLTNLSSNAERGRSKVILVEQARLSAIKENVALRRQRTKEVNRKYAEFKDGFMRFCSRVSGTEPHDEPGFEPVDTLDDQPMRVISM